MEIKKLSNITLKVMLWVCFFIIGFGVLAKSNCVSQNLGKKLDSKLEISAHLADLMFVENQKYKRVFIEMSNDMEDPSVFAKEKVLANLHVIRKAAQKNTDIGYFEEALKSFLIYGGKKFVLGGDCSFALSTGTFIEGEREHYENKMYCVDFYIENEGEEKKLNKIIEENDFEGVKAQAVTEQDFAETKRYAIEFLEKIIGVMLKFFSETLDYVISRIPDMKEIIKDLRKTLCCNCSDKTLDHLISFFPDIKEIIKDLRETSFCGWLDKMADYVIFFIPDVQKIIRDLHKTSFCNWSDEMLDYVKFFISDMRKKIEEIKTANFEIFKNAVLSAKVYNWLLVTDLNGGPLNYIKLK